MTGRSQTAPGSGQRARHVAGRLCLAGAAILSLLFHGACTASGGGASSRTAAALPKPAPALHSADVVGWSGSDLQGRFGPPMLTFAEPPAEVWRYSTAHCVALFFLYPAEAGGRGQAVVRHVELLPRQSAADSDCLREIGEQGTV